MTGRFCTACGSPAPGPRPTGDHLDTARQLADSVADGVGAPEGGSAHLMTPPKSTNVPEQARPPEGENLGSMPPGFAGGPGLQPLAHRTKSNWIALCGGLLIAVVVLGVLWYSDDSNLTNRINRLSSQLSSTNTDLAYAKQAAAHPTLLINNTAQTIPANTGWIAGGVPDTFTYHLAYTSDVMVIYAFVSYHDYVTFATCDTRLFVMNDRSVNKLAGCLEKLGGAYAQASSGADNSVWGAGTSISMNFHGAEGCAGWVSILFPRPANQAARVSPNISVAYNPSSVATGPCA